MPADLQPRSVVTLWQCPVCGATAPDTSQSSRYCGATRACMSKERDRVRLTRMERKEYALVEERCAMSHRCGMEGCSRPLWNPESADLEPGVLHRCGLHEIAGFNVEELREWGEENAADMVDYARAQLRREAA